MSNVLIGIIGVILFIGLALAGALFLGSRFKEARHDAEAASVVQAMNQIVQASNMYRVMEGAASPEDISALVGRYLKSVPKNPLGGDDPYFINASPDIAGSADVVVMDLSNKGEAVCQAVNRQTMGIDTITTVRADLANPPPIRCYSAGEDFFVRAKI